MERSEGGGNPKTAALGPLTYSNTTHSIGGSRGSRCSTPSRYRRRPARFRGCFPRLDRVLSKPSQMEFLVHAARLRGGVLVSGRILRRRRITRTRIDAL